MLDGNNRPIANYVYDAYGTQREESFTYNGFFAKFGTDINKNRYAGQYLDNESGNYYMRARYYDPGMGRFTQEDPVLDGDNWYSYCGGNPVMFINPSGLRNVVIVVGEAGNAGDTFKNAAETWAKEHPEDTVVIIHAGEGDNTGVDEVMKSAGEAFSDGVDVFLYFGHGSSGALYVFEASGENTNIDENTDWSKIKFNKNAVIKIFACYAGGAGRKDKNSIAQKIANKTGRTVYAYVSGAAFTNDSEKGHYNKKLQSGDGDVTIQQGDTWLVPWQYAGNGLGMGNAFARFDPVIKIQFKTPAWAQGLIYRHQHVWLSQKRSEIR